MEPVATHGECSACGTGAVNHRLAYTLDVVDSFFRTTVGRVISLVPLRHESALLNYFQHFTFSTFSLIGLVRFSTEAKTPSTRSQVIWDEAVRRGIEIEQVVIGGRPLDHYRVRIGGRAYYYESIPIPPWVSQQGYLWVDDKLELAKRLDAVGIATPRASAVTTWAEARAALSELTLPLIVKPRFGSRGRHTTTNITTEEMLREAFGLATQIAREIVIQEHLVGSVCRATVVDGKLVGFFKADQPHVIGDGVHTIRELITAKNAARHERVGEITLTEDALAFIARQGYTLESVPPKGARVEITAKTGRFYGGETREMLSDVHPSLKEVFAKAGAAVAAPVLGFDCIMLDPTADPREQRWGIIECNSLPFIDLHYFPLHGEPSNVAKHVWDLWFVEK